MPSKLSHGNSELLFLIGDHGLFVQPIPSLGLKHQALTRRVSTGIPPQ
jgi:hypothetical protein